jgi:hypothetical protein
MGQEESMTLRLNVLQGEVPTIKGNSKLLKGKYTILGFGTPADTDYVDSEGIVRNTCEQALACKAVCYAKQGRYRMPNVANARIRALQHALSETFVDDMVDTLSAKSKRKYNVVRVHDSGDFLSQNNLEDWYKIASRLPNLTFYAYTKRLDLDLWTNKPDNFKMVQSFGGKLDNMVDMSKPHSRIFSSEEARDAAGYVDGNIDDSPAIEGILKIGLVYHGQRNLTEGQKKFFAKGD